jgi:3-phosphoshikimate 1-carboxyvinyltransferase
MAPAGSTSSPKPYRSARGVALKGTVTVPGDKSISHRALMFGALALGQTKITGLLEAEDVINTAKAVSALGAKAQKTGDTWLVTGRGVGGLTVPSAPIDFGNSGTGTRLMMGVIAPHPIEVAMIGDASLSRRPMRRVLDPLRKMGLVVKEDQPGKPRETLPLTVIGTDNLVPMEYVLPVASAQVKSAILIAGLGAPGQTTVIEAEATRDHTERMLRHFGARVETKAQGSKTAITVFGDAVLEGRDVVVPADPSSAAFLAAAAAIVPGSEVTITNVMTNPTRTGFYDTLREMGADVAYLNVRDAGGEDVADIRVRYRALKGVTVPAHRAPSMIDEYPILSVVASCADGTTTMLGLGELKVKESDRLAATARALEVNGIQARVDGDTLHVTGNGKAPKGGGRVETHMDHRIAMSALVLGLASDRPVEIDDLTFVATSFPSFVPLMTGLGATIAPAT